MMVCEDTHHGGHVKVAYMVREDTQKRFFILLIKPKRQNHPPIYTQPFTRFIAPTRT